MKKISLLFISGMLSLSAFSENKTVLTVAASDGSTLEFDITDIKNITFDSEKELMNVNLFEKTETLEISNINDMYFATFDGVESIYDFDIGQDLNVALRFGVLYASQPNSRIDMKIFDMSGKLIASQSAFEELTYSLTDLAGGIYVILVNDKAIKFIR